MIKFFNNTIKNKNIYLNLKKHMSYKKSRKHQLSQKENNIRKNQLS